MTSSTVPFDQLKTADLYVDAIYKGGTANNLAGDPLSRLMRAGVAGGFRWRGPTARPRYVVLYTTLTHVDWPDYLDVETGRFVYYGDNRTPGHDLHRPDGNRILRGSFDAIHDSPSRRQDVPPYFVFAKTVGRDVRFCGLAVPGAPSVPPTDDLVAVWRTSEGQRFQNYRATFTVLDVAKIPRAWLDVLITGKGNATPPQAWIDWVTSGRVSPLSAPRTSTIRTKSEQLPVDERGGLVVRAILDHFENDSYGFERFAAELIKMSDPNVIDCDLTRPWRDGGRDALGRYRIGSKRDSVLVEFALEAKCYSAGGVGVEHTSRLISRLRHRQFGVLVTTSYLSSQAYAELREDDHPVYVVAARDIVEALHEKGLSEPAAVGAWLVATFGPKK